jgi:hypothetical protein
MINDKPSNSTFMGILEQIDQQYLYYQYFKNQYAP